MAQTPFSSEQKRISDKVNHENRHLIYPYIDPLVKHIRYDYDSIDDDIKKYLDSELGIDYSFWVSFPGFPDFMRFFAQYRYRDATQWQSCQDLTITLRNNASDLPGELSKLLAQLFVYGYYAKPTYRLVEVIVANCQKMRNGILTGTLPFKRSGEFNPRSKQPFIAVDFKNLYAQDMVLLHWRETHGKRTLLRRGCLAGLQPISRELRQVNPDVSPIEGLERAEQGYDRRGQPLGLTQRERDILNEVVDVLRDREEDDD